MPVKKVIREIVLPVGRETHIILPPEPEVMSVLVRDGTPVLYVKIDLMREGAETYVVNMVRSEEPLDVIVGDYKGTVEVCEPGWWPSLTENPVLFHVYVGRLPEDDYYAFRRRPPRQRDQEDGGIVQY